ncbi:MAG: helix-hairpin-helix domain-containing protein, partial [bacterium]
VLRRIRDEAHRFALAYHHNLRRKRISESVLDDIPGIGPARKRDLLRRFGSLQRLKTAGVEEIAALPGLGAELAAAIMQKLKQ